MPIAAPRKPLISTGRAAKLIGVHIRTLQRWTEAGLLTPDFVTAGGHRRWDMTRLVNEVDVARLAREAELQQTS